MSVATKHGVHQFDSMKQTSGNNIAWPGQKAKESTEEGKRKPTENDKVQIIWIKLKRLKLGTLELARSRLAVWQVSACYRFLCQSSEISF